MPPSLCSGLLVPKLSKAIPKDLPFPNKAGFEWERLAIQGLVDAGALRLSEKLDDPIHTGLPRLFGKTLGRIDDEMDILYGCTDNDPRILHVTVNSPYYPGHCFYWGSLLKKLTAAEQRLGIPELTACGTQFIFALPLIGGPYAWSDICGYAKDPSDDDPDEDPDFREYDPSKLVGCEEKTNQFIEKLEKARDQKVKMTPDEMISLLISRRSPLGKLFKAINDNPTPACFREGGVMWSAGWQPGDIVDHLWNFLFSLVHNGELEWSDPSIGTASGTVQEIASQARALGATVDAIENLNSYITNEL